MDNKIFDGKILNIDHSSHLPLREISGLSVVNNSSKDVVELLAIGDKNPEYIKFSFDLTEKKFNSVIKKDFF